MIRGKITELEAALDAEEDQRPSQFVSLHERVMRRRSAQEAEERDTDQNSRRTATPENRPMRRGDAVVAQPQRKLTKAEEDAERKDWYILEIKRDVNSFLGNCRKAVIWTSMTEVGALGDIYHDVNESVRKLDRRYGLIEKQERPAFKRTHFKSIVAEKNAADTIIEQALTTIKPIIGFYIGDTPRSKLPSRDDRITLIDQYADTRKPYDPPVSEYMMALFPELFAENKSAVMSRSNVDAGPLPPPTLPTAAPEFYLGLRGPETPPEFVSRVYGSWLGRGLDRAHIRTLDPKLSIAINNWLRKPENEWPKDVDLPTRSEVNRRLLEASPEAVREHLGKFTGSELLREAARLKAAERYRR